MGSYSNRLARSLTLFLSYFLSYFSNHSKYYDYVLLYNISRRKNDFFSPFFFFLFFFDLRTWRPRARTPEGDVIRDLRLVVLSVCALAGC